MKWITRSLMAAMGAGAVMLGSCLDDTSAPGVPVALVEIMSPADTLTALGLTIQLEALAKDANGHALLMRSFSWQSSAPEVATVDTTGLVTAVGNGIATVRAETEEVVGTTAVVVHQHTAVVKIALSLDTLRALNDTVRLVTAAFDSEGHEIDGLEFSWESSDPSATPHK